MTRPEHGPQQESLVQFEGNPRRHLDITGRDYDDTIIDIDLDIETIPKGQKILVIGDGFSDFSAQLQNKRPDLSVISVDRVYGIAKPTDSQKEAGEKLKAAGYSESMINSIFMSSKREFPDDGKKPLYIGADVYKLPFADNSVDKIYTNYLLLHIDFSKALPEILRVLKEGGEVRFGDNGFDTIEKDDLIKMYLGYFVQDMYDGPTLYGPDMKTLGDGIKILADYPETSLYGYMPAKQKNNRPHWNKMKMWILEKGEQLPVFPSATEETSVGRLFKISPDKLNTNDHREPFVMVDEVSI